MTLLVVRSVPNTTFDAPTPRLVCGRTRRALRGWRDSTGCLRRLSSRISTGSPDVGNPTTTILTNCSGRLLGSTRERTVRNARDPDCLGTSRKGSSLSLTSGRERVTLPALIAGELRAQIETRDRCSRATSLPGHRELAASYEVSLGSAREAISLLIGDGLVETRHGRGTFVAEESHLPVRAAAPVGPRGGRGADRGAGAARAADRGDGRRARLRRPRPAAARGGRTDAGGRCRRRRVPRRGRRAFHLLVAEAAHNRFLRQAMHQLSRADPRGHRARRDGGHQPVRQPPVQRRRPRRARRRDRGRRPGRGAASSPRDPGRHHEFVIALYAIGTASPGRTGT